MSFSICLAGLRQLQLQLIMIVAMSKFHLLLGAAEVRQISSLRMVLHVWCE